MSSKIGPLLLAALAALHLPPPASGHANTPPPDFGPGGGQQAHHGAHAQRVQQQQQQPHVGQQAHPPHQQQAGGQPAFGGRDDLKDAEHIKSHLDGKIDTEREMSEEQLQFHYFKMYDADNDGRLDGVELIKAITHSHEEAHQHTQQEQQQQGGQAPQPHEPSTPKPPVFPSEAELEETVDQVLREYDTDTDGYIDYSEFARAVTSGQKPQKEGDGQQQPPPP